MDWLNGSTPLSRLRDWREGDQAEPKEPWEDSTISGDNIHEIVRRPWIQTTQSRKARKKFS